MGDAVARDVDDLLDRARRCARDGNLVEADLASAEALFLTRDDDAAASRRKVLDALCRIYLEDVPVRWSDAYTFPDAAVIRYRETCEGGRRVVDALARAADQRRREAPDEALRFFLAAANVEALFGATGSGRRRVVENVWAVAFEAGRIEEALAAATLVCALVPDFDSSAIDMATAQHKLGRSLLAAGRPAEALASFEKVLETWRAVDRRGGRAHDAILEAEVWVAKAKADSGGADVDETLRRWSSEAEASLGSGDRPAAIAALSKAALLGLESSRATAAERAASALRNVLTDADPPALHAAAEEWLGRALLDLARPAEAVDHLREALRLACDVYEDAVPSMLERYARLVEKAESERQRARP